MYKIEQSTSFTINSTNFFCLCKL